MSDMPELTLTGLANELALWKQHARRWERRYKALHFRCLRLEEQLRDAQTTIEAIQAHQAAAGARYLRRWLADHGINPADLAGFTSSHPTDETARHAAG